MVACLSISAYSQGPSISITLPNYNTYNIACHNYTNGTATASVSGGTAPYSYQWGNGLTTSVVPTGASTSSISGLRADSYILTVTDASSNTATATATLNQPSELYTSVGGYSPTPWAGDTVTFINSTSGGVGDYNYIWSGPNSFSSTNQNPSFVCDTNMSGIYYVTVTDANSCAFPDYFNITVGILNHVTVSLKNFTQPTDTTLEYDVYIVSDGSPESALVTTTSNCNFGINFNTGILPSGATLTEDVISGTSDLSLTMTYPSGSYASGYFLMRANFTAGSTLTVGQPYRLARARLTCSGGKWVTNSAATFSLQATSATGKTNTNFYALVNSVSHNFSSSSGDNYGRNLSVSGSPTLNACGVSATAGSTPASCYGGGNGSVTATAASGWPPYSYSWSNGATVSSVNSLTAATYTITITDDIGCTATASATVSQPSALSPIATATAAVSCHGGSNGAASVTASGGSGSYTYSWTGGTSATAITGLSAATYSITVTDAHSCTAATTATITQPTALTATLASALHHGFQVSIHGDDDGEIEGDYSGGTTSYSYLWNTGATTAAITGLTAGAYTLTLTDAHACTVTSSTTLSEPPVLTITGLTKSDHNGYNVSCNGGDDGWIIISATGGIATYDYTYYVISNSIKTTLTSDTASLLAAGNYTLEVDDVNGATATVTATLSEPPALSITLTATQISDTYTGKIVAVIAGGVPTYTNNWYDPTPTIIQTSYVNRDSIQDLADHSGEGLYSLSVTDANGCTASDAKWIYLTIGYVGAWWLDGNDHTDPTQDFIGTTDSTDLVFKTDSIERLRIKADGTMKLSSYINSDTSSQILYMDHSGGIHTLGLSGLIVSPCFFPPSPYWRTQCDGNSYHIGGGAVGIETTTIPSGYRLAVNGNIICTELQVELYTSWDYVFDKKYKLRSIYDLEKFINEKNHLPNFKSAKEMEANNGIGIGEFQSSLLRTAEELTLYSIQQQHQLDKQQQQIDRQQHEIDELKNEMDEMKKNKIK